MNKITSLCFKTLLIAVLLFTVSTKCFSQNTAPKSDFWNKVRIGGGIGLNFSNGGFNGSLSPSALYEFNDYVAAGLGVNVNYNKFNNENFWAYGPSAIVLANPIPQIQISGEYEQLRVNSSFQTANGTLQNDFWSPALFFGVGYRSQFATVGLRYNVLHDNQDSIYLNALVPFVRVYF